jgi:hypothetical protein
MFCKADTMIPPFFRSDSLYLRLPDIHSSALWATALIITLSTLFYSASGL